MSWIKSSGALSHASILSRLVTICQARSRSVCCETLDVITSAVRSWSKAPLSTASSQSATGTRPLERNSKANARLIVLPLAFRTPQCVFMTALAPS